jgi:hypothetical protein
MLFSVPPGRVVLVLALVLGIVAGGASASERSTVDAAAAKISRSAKEFESVHGTASALCIVRTQDPKTGRFVPVWKTKTIRVKGKKKKVFVYRTVKKKIKVRGRSVTRNVRVRVPKKAACAKTKLCVVKTKNSRGISVTVYLTRVIKVKVKKNGKFVKKNGKFVTKKKRVFVYKTKIKHVKLKRSGKVVTVRKRVYVYRKVKGKKVKIKVPKYGACKKTATSAPGIPVKVTLLEDSMAHLDFGGFQRDIPLSGELRGFIVGKGFVLGQTNLINLTRGRVNLAQTGIFIDDDCNGEVSDAIRTDGTATYTEIDPTSTANNITVKADSAVSGLLHMRVQAALQMRNEDTGCNDPYFTTGYTDFTIPLFVKGKLSAGRGGLLTTLTVGETILDDLSACLAIGPVDQPCNGFAIPFPAVLTADIVSLVKVG